MNKKHIRIILTGGGTGGHVFPLVAVAREIKKLAQENHIETSLIYIGPVDYTTQALTQEGVVLKKIIAGKWRREFSFANIFDLFKTAIGCLQSFFWLFFYMPEAVFSKGGFGAFPVCLIATIFHIPLYEHESDTIPGLVSNLFKKTARKIFVSFKSALAFFPIAKTYVLGSPIREAFYADYDIKNCRQVVGLKDDKPVVVVLGGSQGAQFINTLIVEGLADLLPECQVVHQTGPTNLAEVSRMAEVMLQEFDPDQNLRVDYHPVAFLDEQAVSGFKSLYNVLASADLVVTRAGSGSIAELSAMGKPMILIPLSSASQNHQWKNANAVANEGAGIILEQGNLKANTLAQTIVNLLHNPERLASLSSKSKALGLSHKQAAQNIAEMMLQDIFR